MIESGFAKTCCRNAKVLLMITYYIYYIYIFFILHFFYIAYIVYYTPVTHTIAYLYTEYLISYIYTYKTIFPNLNTNQQSQKGNVLVKIFLMPFPF